MCWSPVVATLHAVTPLPNLAASDPVSSAQGVNAFVHCNLEMPCSHLASSSRAFLMLRQGWTYLTCVQVQPEFAPMRSPLTGGMKAGRVDASLVCPLRGQFEDTF